MASRLSRAGLICRATMQFYIEFSVHGSFTCFLSRLAGYHGLVSRAGITSYLGLVSPVITGWLPYLSNIEFLCFMVGSFTCLLSRLAGYHGLVITISRAGCQIWSGLEIYQHTLLNFWTGHPQPIFGLSSNDGLLPDMIIFCCNLTEIVELISL